MCNAIRDGGRRCPLHQHTNQAVINTVVDHTGMKFRQVQNLFRALRREGHGSQSFAESVTEREIVNIRNLNPNLFDEQYRRALRTGEEVDNRSLYAIGNILQRTLSQKAALESELQQVADRTGYTLDELKEKYSEEYEAVDTRRGAGIQEEFTPAARYADSRDGLPYDRASVVALAKIRQLTAPVDRVRRINEWVPFNSTMIEQAGYHEGRLEIQFHSTPGVIYAYRNIPQSMWDRLRNASRPGSVYSRSIRGNSEFSYLSREESEEYAYTLRCRACGQYRSQESHDCPGVQAQENTTPTSSSNTAVRLFSETNTMETMQEFVASEYMQDRLPNSTIVQVQNGDVTRNVISIGNDRDEQDFRANSGSMRSRMCAAFTTLFNDPANPTPEEIHSFIETLDTLNTIDTVTTRHYMNVVRDHLRNYDFRFPVTAHFRNAQVEGDMTVARLADNQQLIDAISYNRNLRCNCPQYAENYDCEHVRATANNPYMFLANRSRLFSTENDMASYERIHRTEVEVERATSRIMTQRNLSREEALQYAQNERERAEAARVEAAERRAREQAERELRQVEAGRRRAESLNTTNRATVALNNQYRERMLQRWEDQEPGYSENIDQLYEDYKETRRRKRAGEVVMEYRTENVTDGICADEPGARRFGVELEFTIGSGHNRREALQNIARELHEAGLTESSYQQSYHAARYSGWGSWSFEEDGTVDGELVSPIMSDTPEHWEQLRTACEIISRNGGVASTQAGSHVHISTGSYEMSTAKHVELLRQVNQNDEMMYRLATNPTRGTHRGTSWCAPNVNDGMGSVSADVISSHNVLGAYHSSHSYALNFETTYQDTYSRSNIEFRMWDATLDPAVIQRQVMISAAMTDQAERNVLQNGETSPLDSSVRRGVGERRRAETTVLQGGRTHNRETFEQTMGNLPTFLDSLFRKSEDRKSIVDLFAVTSWQRG